MIEITEDIQIEIDYYGDELNAVFRKGDKVYIYPLDEVAEIVNRLYESGALVIDNTVEGDYTVYYQGE